MDLGLKGKTVIVVGGSSHIGRHTVFGFARDGANVVIADWDEAQGKKTVEDANGLEGEVSLIVTDITKMDQIEAMVEKVIGKYGKIDILVNNVGFSHIRPFVDCPWEDLEREADVNLWGTVRMCKAVIPHMIAAKKGSIVNIGSDAGRVGQEREAFYGGTKGAIIAFGKGLAKEMGRKHNVRVNCICPGSIPVENQEDVGEKSVWKTPDVMNFFTPEHYEKVVRYFYPRGRLGKPRDVANAIVFIASDAADFITGQTLSLSGGYTML